MFHYGQYGSRPVVLILRVICMSEETKSQAELTNATR